MVRIIVKEVNDKDMDGKLSFREQNGLECTIHLPSFSKGVNIGYDGSIDMESQDNYDILTGLWTNEVYINVTPWFTKFFELHIDYNRDYVNIRTIHIDDEGF